MAAVAPPLQWCVPIIDCELIHAFVCHCMLDLANAMRYEPPMPDPFTLFTQWSGPMMRAREVCYLANNKNNYERTIFPQSSMQLCIYLILLCWVALVFFVLHLLHFAPGCPTMRLARPSCIKIMKRCKALWTIGLDVDHWFMTTQTISLGAVTSDKGSQSSFATAANSREKPCKCICFQLFTWNTNHAAHSAWKLEAFICCWQHIFSTQCFSDMKSASLYP